MDEVKEQQEYGPEIFDELPSSKYLKIKPGQEVIVGIKNIIYIKTKFPSDPTPKPALVLYIDDLNGQPLSAPMEFTITGRYFANIVREYKKSPDIKLSEWLFKIKRNGTGMETRYVFTPHAKRTSHSVL